MANPPRFAAAVNRTNEHMRTLNIKAFIIVLLTLGSSALLANAQLAFTAVDQVGLDGVPGSITANTDHSFGYLCVVELM